MFRRFAQISIFLLSMFAFTSSAFAGPVGDALREVADAVDAAEEKLGDMAEDVKENIIEIISPVVREVQGHLNAAKSYADDGDTAKARAHAIAARHALRTMASKLGIEMEPLPPNLLKLKAGKDARYKKAVKKLPSGKILLLGPCQMPKCSGKQK